MDLGEPPRDAMPLDEPTPLPPRPSIPEWCDPGPDADNTPSPEEEEGALLSVALQSRPTCLSSLWL